MSSEKKTPAEWQPIETAPRDGTWVLVFHPGHQHGHVCSWDKIRRSWRLLGGCIFSGAGDEPTHWMPLPGPPPPPKTDEERAVELLREIVVVIVPRRGVDPEKVKALHTKSLAFLTDYDARKGDDDDAG